MGKIAQICKYLYIHTLSKAQICLSSGKRVLIGIPLITSASQGKNRLSTTSEFQQASSLLIALLLAYVSGCKNNLGEETLYVDGVGNQLSPHTCTLSPLSILHFNPNFTKSCAAQMLRQVNDELFPKGAYIQSHIGKYFALRTLYANESCYIWSHHPCFANKAKLNCFSGFI